MTSSRLRTQFCSKVLAAVIAAGTVAPLAACGKGEMPAPKPEVVVGAAKVNLPQVPAEAAFAIPKTSGNTKSVKDLRVNIDSYLGQQLTVHGYVIKTYTWAKDCVPTVKREAGATDEQVLATIEADPQLCERIKFYIGDEKDTPLAQALWIVEAPRLPTKIEIERLPKEEIENKRMWKEVIPYEVGDEVEVTGTFAKASNTSERNERGLLMYDTMKNVTQNLESLPLPPEGAATIAPPAH